MKSLVKELFFFLFAAVVKAYGSEVMLPPDFRNHYQNPSYTEIITPPALPFSLPRFFPSYLRLLGVGYCRKRLGLGSLHFKSSVDNLSNMFLT